MRKLAFLPLAAALAYGVWLLAQAGEPCRPIIEYARYSGLSPIPDFIKQGLEYETVTISLCPDGTLRGSVTKHGGDPDGPAQQSR